MTGMTKYLVKKCPKASKSYLIAGTAMTNMTRKISAFPIKATILTKRNPKDYLIPNSSKVGQHEAANNDTPV